MAEPRARGEEVRSKGWTPSLGGAFRMILVARMISVFCMHISDCDETYNYWEPFHYVLFGSGFQTWEYSPVYAIRSYGYILLHVPPMLLTRAGNKLVVFFLMRVVLAFFCTVCEYYFYRGVLHKFGARIAKWTLIFLVFSCGMYIACTAFLPSSFAMYFTMVAMGAWYLENYELAIFATAVSAIVGWPFSAAIGLPIALDLLVSKRVFLFFAFWSTFSFIIITVPLVFVDSLYYGKFVLAPWNILMYNVFGKGGPNLYGVEPWSYYFFNGFLNFNVVFILALLAIPLIEFQVFFDALVVCLGRSKHWFETLYSILLTYSGKGPSKNSSPYRQAVQSMLIWMLIFFTRPHKEERFLFPIYPLFCLSAAVALCLLPEVMPVVWGLLRIPRVLRKLSRSILSVLPIVTGTVFVLVSFSRGYALYKGYHAPIGVYTHLHAGEIVTLVQPIHGDVNVCVGKEWYRFPSSFYLPSDKWKLKFLRSEFKGQLPKEYSEGRNGTRIIPEDMNDMNKEEPSRYFDVTRCHFLVDLDLPVSSELEPRFARDTNTWQLIAKYPFLDAERSHKLYRAFYVPWLSKRHTTYADYVLLINRRLFEKIKQKLTPDYPHSF